MLSHHAILKYVPSDFVVRDYTCTFEDQAEIDIVTVERLSIHDVRRLIERAYQTPFEKPIKLCVIQATAIAHEAQQALLKILEEPPHTTQFVLLLPREIDLLPTIYSRVVTESYDISQTDFLGEEFSEFLSQSAPERHALIARAAKQKDDNYFGSLRNGLTYWLSNYKSVTAQSTVTQLHAALYGPGASKKMIWEELAFLLPVVPGDAQ